MLQRGVPWLHWLGSPALGAAVAVQDQTAAFLRGKSGASNGTPLPVTARGLSLLVSNSQPRSMCVRACALPAALHAITVTRHLLKSSKQPGAAVEGFGMLSGANYGNMYGAPTTTNTCAAHRACATHCPASVPPVSPRLGASCSTTTTSCCTCLRQGRCLRTRAASKPC